MTRGSIHRYVRLALLVVALDGCRRHPPPHSATTTPDLGPLQRWVERIGDVRVVTVLQAQTDLVECKARPHGCWMGKQEAAAARFHAEIWWTWIHPCGSVIEPDIGIGERVIGVAANTTSAVDAGGHECFSQLKTVLDPLPARRWRIVGQGRFDVLLDVPSTIVH